MTATGLALVTLIVPDYDEALRFFTRVLAFDLVDLEQPFTQSEVGIHLSFDCVFRLPDVECGRRNPKPY